MTDPQIVRHSAIGLIALVVIAASPAAAQTRTDAQMDQAITQQQAALEQLTASVAQLQKENAALKSALADVSKTPPAPPEAWQALGTVGLVFVLTWGAVALVREWLRMKETQMDLVQKQAKMIEDAADARVKALTGLLREARVLADPRRPDP